MMVPLMFGITIISFIVIHLAPGGPVEVQIEMQMKASAEARENLKRLYGLDKPLHEQYMDWLRRLGTLDFGGASSYLAGPGTLPVGITLYGVSAELDPSGSYPVTVCTPASFLVP